MNLLKLLFSAPNPNSPAVRTITATEAAQLITENRASLVDVREPSEWKGGVAAPAHLLSLSDLKGRRQEWEAFLAENGNRELILYCQAGGRSGSAAAILAAEGHRVANLGGFAAWRDAKLPVRLP